MTDEWYIYEDKVTCGPFSVEELAKMAAAKRITTETMTRRGKYSSWRRVREQPALKQICEPESKTTTIQEQTANANVNVKTAVFTGVAPDGSGVKIACPSCGQKYKIASSEYSEGALAECLKCKGEFILPSQTGNAAQEDGQNLEQDMPSGVPEGPIACPHCFRTFPKERVLYISAHPSLMGDDVAGDFEQKRFAPSVFDSRGLALDSAGSPCTDMACPHCHLRLPGAIIDLDSLHFSIVGAPASGKSYYLTALIHTLRRIMPQNFSYMFADTDPLMNRVIDNYENTIFASPDPKGVSLLPKTQQTGGDFSSHVTLNGVPTDLARPFIFELKSMNGDEAKNIIFYDNAGEHFQPGADTLLNPATVHLAHSDGIIFIFDPINDAIMRKNCVSDDPQLEMSGKISDQTILFSEMTTRIRRHKNMTSQEKCSIPLVVAVNKYDAWRSLLKQDVAALTPVTDGVKTLDSVIDTEKILDVSYAVRGLLEQFAPGLVGAAETFFDKVIFVPVSSFGTSAKKADDGAIGITPGELKPVWVETPFLLLAYWNNVIQRSEIAASKDVLPMPEAVINGEMIVYRNPENAKRCRLPDTYAGAVITIGNKKYRLPEADTQRNAVDTKKPSGKKDLWS